MKVVGIGLGRTGTTTLGACLKQLGYNHVSYDFDTFSRLIDGEMDSVMAVVDRFESFDDWPWPLLYRDIDRRYPDAKFILTVRRDAQVWYRSMCALSVTLGDARWFSEYVFGHEMPQGYRAQYVDYYERHNAEVRAYFADRPSKLLEICWEEGDGWEQLAPFLGADVPASPLPHANKTTALVYYGDSVRLALVYRWLNRTVFRSLSKARRAVLQPVKRLMRRLR